MTTRLRTLSILTALAVLAGCALPGSVATNISADELVRQLGKPTETRANPAGGESWDYVYGPAGMQTWRFTIDAGRMVRAKEPLLTDERFYRIVPGTTTQAEVRDLLGKPSGITQLAMGPVWDWRIDMNPTPGHYFVNFDRSGVAVSVGIMMDIRTDGDKTP
ncbi:MAG: hypothetical protein FJY56_09505 [Betaproteobacteria bacterium]|nr:hypothetical protein [Betaproteobacteria bacterium]